MRCPSKIFLFTTEFNSEVRCEYLEAAISSEDTKMAFRGKMPMYARGIEVACFKSRSNLTSEAIDVI